MTDITINQRPAARTAAPSPAGAAGDPEVVALIELLFFAYRDFVSDPDQILKRYHFGRAHHRVIHFVGRNPGMRVAELLDILRITKQSLSRVLRELIERGFVVQQEGQADRRQRLLYLTPKGSDLHRQLIAPQLKRIRSALDATGDGASDQFQKLLFEMIDVNDRRHVLDLIGTGGSGGDA